jgi:ATP-independent RNA helicase DbpA
MLDMGFADEIDAILSYLPEPRQNLLFSATYPDEVAEVVAALCPDAARIDVTESETAPSISEYWCHAPSSRQQSDRVEVLGKWITPLGRKT